MNNLANPGQAGGLGHPYRAHDIDGGVELRIRHRTTDVDLSGQVVDHLGLGFGQQPDQVGVHDIGLDERESIVATGPVQIAHPAGTEIVDADHGVAVSNQPVDQCGADESGRPGDQCPHPATIPAAQLDPPVQSRRCLFGRPHVCQRSPQRPRR